MASVAGMGLSASPASAAVVGCTVNVVAHPDDDLFFQNPDVRNDIVARRCVSTVYVTSGDAGQGATYSRSREKGVQAAYAQMAGVANKWLTVPVPTGGQVVTSSVLSAAPWVSMTFLRLPDGNMDGSGTAASQFTSLQQLYLGQIPSLKTVDSPIQTYTTASLIRTLGQVFTTQNASTVRTLDYLGDFDEGDHSDHYTVARLASIARATYKPAATFLGYLGYPSSTLPANVGGTDLDAKWTALMTYAPFDTSSCPNPTACYVPGDTSWIERQHLATELHAARPVTPGNVAPLATVSASSQNTATSQTAKKAVDGVIDGSPGDYTAEWATNGGTTGSWLQLNWIEPIQMDTVVLFDRPNAYDQVTGGTVTFSDGSKVTVPALDNAGGPVTVKFPSKSTSSLRFTVTGVSATTGNVGLAELQAWTTGSTPAPSPAPAAPAAPAAPVAPAVPAAPVTPPDTTPTPAPPSTATDLASTATATVGPGSQPNGVGTWFQLSWDQPVTAGRIVVTNATGNMGVTGATVTFSDGSSVTVPASAMDGKTITVSFPPRATSTLRITVTSVKGNLATSTKPVIGVFSA